jgi:hypothetical protein
MDDRVAFDRVDESCYAGSLLERGLARGFFFCLPLKP